MAAPGGYSTVELEKLLHDGVELMLQQAKERRCLQPPFGRPVLSPLGRGSDDADANGDDSDFDSDDSDSSASSSALEMPPFEYDYGFNPLIFLAKHLRRCNPINVVKRAAERTRSLEYLQKRARHGIRQLDAFNDLQEKMRKLRTGVTHGPFCGQVGPHGATLYARASRGGKPLEFVVARDPTFKNTVVNTEVIATADNDLCAQVVVKDILAPETKYYVRCALFEPHAGYPGTKHGFHCSGSFTTAPDGHDRVPLTFCLSSLAGQRPESGEEATQREREEVLGAYSNVSASQPGFFILAGDPIFYQRAKADEKKASGSADGSYLASLRNAHKMAAEGDTSLSSLLSTVPVVIPHNDPNKPRRDSSQPPNGQRKNKRRTTRNRRTHINRPVKMSESRQAFCEHWPQNLGEKNTLHWHFHYGEAAEFFVLDTQLRRIDDDQLLWLRNNIRSSHSTWKFIITPTPLAYSALPPPVPAEAEEQWASQSKAATKIQAQHRGRSSRKKVKDGPEAPDSTPAPEGPNQLEQLLEWVKEDHAENVVLLSGDTGFPFAVSHSKRLHEFGGGNMWGNATTTPAAAKHGKPLFTGAPRSSANNKTFGVISISADEELTYTCKNLAGEEVFSTMLHPSDS